MARLKKPATMHDHQGRGYITTVVPKFFIWSSPSSLMLNFSLFYAMTTTKKSTIYACLTSSSTKLKVGMRMTECVYILHCEWLLKIGLCC